MAIEKSKHIIYRAQPPTTPAKKLIARLLFSTGRSNIENWKSTPRRRE